MDLSPIIKNLKAKHILIAKNDVYNFISKEL